ncbi:MAG: hypothetical protein ABR878_05380 [Roseiarcus sp.]|jgi:hypothetical protein
MLKSIFAVLVVVLIVVGARNLLAPAAQPPQTVAIADILRNPAAYDGKPVSFRGAVLGRASVFGVGAYRVGAPNGASILVAGLATAPAIGEQAEVTGVFHMAVAIGEFQAPVVIAR